jgi:FG-GAP repeat protein
MFASNPSPLILLVLSGLLFTVPGTIPTLGAQPDTAYLVLDGQAPDAKLGAYVARVPDVTGDGVDELVSGNHRADGPGGVDAGRVLLFNGATGQVLWTLEGESAGGLLGHNVWGIHDLDGDACGDVIASAYRFNFPGKNGAGKVYVLSGRTGRVIWTRDGEFAGDEFGFTLADVPDVDGDKIDDVLVGAWLNDTGAYLAGKVYLYSGKTGSLIHTHQGFAADDRFGCAGAGFPDLDGDNRGDYVIGALYAGPNGEGQAYLYSGRNGVLLRTMTGERPTDLFGISVAAVPDTDGDRYDDILIGARDHDTNKIVTDAGRAYLYSGRSGTFLFSFDGETYYDKFGRFCTGLPDVNDDGYGDVAVGAYYHAGNNILESGAAYVFCGHTGQRLFKYVGEAEYNMFGFALCGLNDVNGDRRGDLVVGAYQYLPNPQRTESYGRIYVYTQGLQATASTISASAGGTIGLAIDAGRKNRTENYLVVASVSGNHPGLLVAGKTHVPVNFDLFTLASWIYANSPFMVNTYAATDSTGQAKAEFRAPAGFLRGYEGMKLTFVCALENLSMVSCPVTVRIGP